MAKGSTFAQLLRLGWFVVIANIFDVQRASTVDGPGFRTTVFFKGCNLRCTWCHNPESQSHEKEILYYRDRCTHCGICEEVCPFALKSCNFCGECVTNCPQEARSLCGRNYSINDLISIIKADRLFYRTTKGGVTFSGGECMLQHEYLAEILHQCKDIGIHTAVDTAGHVPFSSFERILPYTDLILFDIKLMNSELHEKYTGVRNDLILNNLAKLLRRNVRIWVRIPIIPGVNDTEEEMIEIRSYFDRNGFPDNIELLPYHRMGESKLAAMNRKVQQFLVPDKELIANLTRIVTS